MGMGRRFMGIMVDCKDGVQIHGVWRRTGAGGLGGGGRGVWGIGIRAGASPGQAARQTVTRAGRSAVGQARGQAPLGQAAGRLADRPAGRPAGSVAGRQLARPGRR